MTFQEALEVLLKGGKVRRGSWRKCRFWRFDNSNVLSEWSDTAVMIHRYDMHATDWEEAQP